VTIGGETILLPPIMNFATLERVWPALKALDQTQDVIERTASRIAIVSGVLLGTRPDLTVPVIKAKLLIKDYNEIAGLIDPVHRLMVASGLLSEGLAPGEAAPPAPPADPAPTDPTSSTSSPS
jgi:hypothetical protein